MARIVVVQEIQANMRRVRHSLEPIGHVVIGFSSQRVAIAYLKEEKVDMIISAVHLLEGDVFDFLKWSRSHPTNQSTPFVFFFAEPTYFGRHVFGAVKSAGELLGVSKYILMDSFDAIQFRSEVAKLLAPSSASSKNSVQERKVDGSRNLKIADQSARETKLEGRQSAERRFS
jgi:response regulator RpfG family c-di-GMP phosphodiesterase